MHILLPALLALIALVPGRVGAATIESARLRAELGDSTGALLALVDRSDGLALAAASPDRYALQPDPTTEVTATEAEDVVVSREGGTWLCRNPKLPGVVIRKRYALADRWLEKRVEFTAEGRDLGLLKHTVTTTCAPDFYRDGYLNDPSRHPQDYPYLHTRDLTSERPIRDSHAVADHHWAIYTSPKTGRGLAQYRFEVDDRYVHPLSSYAYEPGLTYGPTGWRVAVACQWLSDNRPGLSTTCRWQLFEGDHIAFHQAYLALPEVRAEYDFESPSWLRDVKRIMSWNYGHSSFRIGNYQQAAESLDGGVMMVMLGQAFTNTRRYLADPLIGPYDDQIDLDDLRRLVDSLHAIGPQVKVGAMTWQWAFGDKDPVFREHPEWTVHGGDGQPVFAASGWANEKVYSQLLTPEARAYNLEQFRGLVRRLDLDFIYMDTGQGGVTRFDWRTRTSAQDYDWADFYRGIRDAARSNRNGATFFNGTPQLYSQYADVGYFEGMGFVRVRDWRAMADRLLLVKLYQPGEKWTVPLYWQNENLDEYINYCYLLGLRPGEFGGTVGAIRWPMVDAALELGGMRLVPAAEARPCWWKEQTDAEVYALRVQGGGFLNVYWHGKTAGRVSASCAVAALGLDPRQPVQAWLFEPRPAAEVLATTTLNERETNALYRAEGNAAHRVMKATHLGALEVKDGRVEVGLELAPERVGLVLLTQSPTLAYAIDGRPTQLLLPPPAGAAAEVVASNEAEPAALTARRYAYQVPAERRSPGMFAETSSPATVNQKVTEVGRTVAGMRVERLLTLDCEHNTLDVAGAELLADRVRLTADMQDEKLYGFAGAALEAPQLGRLGLRLELGEPLYKRFSASTPTAFVGLVADYHTPAGFSRRVRFGLVPCRAEALVVSRPWWGAFTAGQPVPTRYVDLSGQVPVGQPTELTLDLGRYAPEGWDGRVIFGPLLESCGLGSRLTVEVMANGPAGGADPQAFSPLPVVEADDGSVLFQGAGVKSFEDGAKLEDGKLVFPPNACIEGSGFRVITWQVKRAADSKELTLMVNFQLPGGKYQLVQRDLTEFVKPGSEGRFDLDLGQFAPEGWNGRIRMRLRGDHFEAAMVANSSFQLF